MKPRLTTIYLSVFALLAISCIVSCSTQPKEDPIFEMLDASKTGIEFANNLHPTETFNMFHYMYYYNGAGVATGAGATGASSFLPQAARAAAAITAAKTRDLFMVITRVS